MGHLTLARYLGFDVSEQPDERREVLVSLSRKGAAADASIFARLRMIDPVLLVATLGLCGFGVLAVALAGAEDRQYYVSNQIVGLIVGGLVAVALTLFDYRRLESYLHWLYGAAIFMLLAVLAVGVTVNGAQNWLDIGPIQVQPSEFAKPLVIVVLAGYIARKNIGGNKTFLKALGILVLPMLLVLAEPDLGTALVFGTIFIPMAFVAGAKLYQLIALLAAGVGAFALSVKLGVLEQYQLERLTSFLDQSGRTDAGYQVAQSKAAIGSGGLLGKGLNDQTTLGDLGFLPEDHTDFIFANLAERVGFAGSALLLLLFFVLVWRILRVATATRGQFGILIATGVSAMFLSHVFINVGMNMGMMPVTGIPLPFVSYGRSNLLVSLASLGLLQSIAIRAKLESSVRQ